MRSSFATAALAAACAASLAACQRNEVTHATVAREEPRELPKAAPAAAGQLPPGHPPIGDGSAASTASAPMAGNPSGMPAMGSPFAEGGGPSIQWKLPNGWTESHPGGMRYATLKPAQQGKIDVSVIVLPGPAGGDLANVNRWRGQVGLAPIDDATLEKGREKVKAGSNATVSVFDFTSDGQQKTRMVAAIALAEGNTWFLKMVGDAEAVGAARGDFMNLLRSVHFDATH